MIRRIAAFAGIVASVAYSQPGTAHRHSAVSIRGFAFTPAELIVSVGDTIEWRNGDQLVHTTASDSSAWSSPELPAGERFVWVASSPGRFPYHCGAHPVMRGVVVVRP